jgi:hypothetical protein
MLPHTIASVHATTQAPASQKGALSSSSLLLLWDRQSVTFYFHVPTKAKPVKVSTAQSHYNINSTIGTTEMRHILHADFDVLYALVEQLDNPRFGIIPS